MNNKAVIFDMDGVICHTNPFHSQAFDAFFSKRNIPASEASYREHMYGKSNSYIFSHYLGREIKGEQLRAMESEKEGLFREIYGDQVTAISGFSEFLIALKTLKMKTGVATSAPIANLNLIIGKLNIADLMESTMASEDVINHKPDPEIYLKSADNLGLSPRDCVVFEDSFSGVTAALNAGMKVVGVLSSHTKDELPPCNLYISEYSGGLIPKVLSLL